MTERRTSQVAGQSPLEERLFPKQCSCGALYGESEWETLPLHGIAQGTDDSTGRRFGLALEIRVCICGSSMGQYMKAYELMERGSKGTGSRMLPDRGRGEAGP